MGPCAGGDVYSPAMTDFIFMVKDTSYMFVTGPDVVKTVTNEVVTAEELGGASVHATQILDRRRRVRERCRDAAADAPADRLPAEQQHRRRAGMAELRRHRARGHVARHADPGQSEQALRHEGADPEGRGRGRLLRDLARLSPRTSSPASAASRAGPSGFVANQPMVLAGVLDSDASRKAARFVRFCDAFNIPIVTFVDVPGFLPGTAQEYGGLDQARRQAAVRLSPRRRCRWSP